MPPEILGWLPVEIETGSLLKVYPRNDLQEFVLARRRTQPTHEQRPWTVLCFKNHPNLCENISEAFKDESQFFRMYFGM